MDEAGLNWRRARRALPLAAAALALLLALSPGPAAAQKRTEFKSGTYKGKTNQENVATDARRLELRVKKGKVTLLTEPVVRRDFCLSPPVFTIGGETPVARLNKKGAFSFTRTFLGSRIDRIKGSFVDGKKIEGIAVYHFEQQELCSGGKTRVKFTLGSGKKKKK